MWSSNRRVAERFVNVLEIFWYLLKSLKKFSTTAIYHNINSLILMLCENTYIFFFIRSFFKIRCYMLCSYLENVFCCSLNFIPFFWIWQFLVTTGGYLPWMVCQTISWAQFSTICTRNVCPLDCRRTQLGTVSKLCLTLKSLTPSSSFVRLF